jgi:trehalose 6-phosphate phosphatase
MQHLFTAEGKSSLAAILARRPLLAFDFDGTLAPIVSRPDDARVAIAVASRLRTLATRLPVAIITGRTIEDVRPRLGFVPHYVIGNHGAEDAAPDAGHTTSGDALDPLRAQLVHRGTELSASGISVEDKGLSIALHYRLARDRPRAKTLIDALLSSGDVSVRVFAGKMVVNIAPVGAPDKAHAMHALVARSGASCALFAGDDVNDEPVFAAAQPSWLTLRVGRDDPASRARYFLDGQQEMAMLLQCALELLSPDHPNGGGA